MSDNHNNNPTAHAHNHPHFAAQPIEISQYTYDAHKPSTLATRNLLNQDPTQHSPTSPSGPTPSRIHPVAVEHPHDHKNPKPHHHIEPHADPEPHHHPEPQYRPDQRHDEHHAPSSPTSTIGSDSIQSSPMFGNAERRQSWSKDEMKRGAMEGLLEKGKGKQAKGGYTSTS